AEDGTTFKDYEVNVSKAGASIQNSITEFRFNALEPDVIGTINQVTNAINLTVPFATNLATLVATFTNSPLSAVSIGGVPQASGVTANDFTADKVYRVTAESGAVKDYTVHVAKAAASGANSILTFGFLALDPDVIGTINQTNHTIGLTVPFGTDVTNLVATFTSSDLSTVWIGGVQQTSATTANNFTAPVIYKCRAEDNSEELYTVTVTITPASTANQILTFSFLALDPDVIGTVNQTAKTIALTVPFTTNVTALVPTFTHSTFATVWIGGVQQTSGVTAADFSAPVAYKCRAQDGSEEIYTVTVTKSAVSTACLITAFRFEAFDPDVVGAIVQTAGGGTITATIPFSGNLADLVATFTLSPLATATIGVTAQTSGVTHNSFVAAVTYTVTAEDGVTIKTYVVTVTKAAVATGNSITEFRFNALDPDVIGTINQTAHTIALTVPFGTDVTALVANFTASAYSVVTIGGVVQVSGTNANDFTAPKTYVVTSESGVAQNYIVTVTITVVNAGSAITDFRFAALNPVVYGTINQTTHAIALIVPFATNVTTLVATFTASPFATVTVGGVPQVSATTANNFVSPLTYHVTAQDGTHTTDYIVTVTIYEIPKQFTAFSISGTVTLGTDVVNYTANGTINNVTKTIQVNVPFSAVRTSMVATFALSAGTTAHLGGVLQVSGTTANDFTAVRTYTLLATDGSTTTYAVTVLNNPVVTDKQILTFNISSVNPVVAGTIDQTAKTIAVTLPVGSSKTALIATFTTSSGLNRVKIGTVAQVSGTTVNNFTNPVTYTVYDENNATADYVVTVTVTSGSSAKSITYFAFLALDPDVTCAINEGASTITGTVPNGTNRAALVATYTHSANSVVRIQNQGIQQSGLTINDFRMPVIYEVTAQDNSTRTYTVTISEAADTTKPVVSNAAQAVTNLAGQFVILRSNEATGKVYIIKNTALQTTVANLETAVTAGLGRAAYVTAANTDIPISTYNLSDGIYNTYAIDAAGNKSLPGTNHITILDRTAPTVSVAAQTITNALNHVVAVTSSETDSFVYLIKEGEPQMSKAQLDIAVNAKRGSRGLVVAANVPVNLSVYQLVAGNYHAYAVDYSGNLSNASTNIVSITEASRLKSILAFNFLGLTPPAIGQIIGTDISVVVPVGTNVTALVATFTLSPLSIAYVGAIQQTSGVTPNNFTNQVVYRVEAEDGSTLDYIITVSFNTGIDDNAWMNAIKAYPNPFSDHLTIEMPLPADRIQVMNTLGQTVAEIREPGMRTVEISTDSWENGLYMIRFIRDNRIVGVQKLMRN
ncbi:MAG: T9SS type A sorting domain-containing protein, partial [Bacteroidota bacterium]